VLTPANALLNWKHPQSILAIRANAVACILRREMGISYRSLNASLPKFIHVVKDRSSKTGCLDHASTCRKGQETRAPNVDRRLSVTNSWVGSSCSGPRRLVPKPDETPACFDISGERRRALRTSSSFECGPSVASADPNELEPPSP
jgi:hypothetical protein